jgi:hypothetical protein
MGLCHASAGKRPWWTKRFHGLLGQTCCRYCFVPILQYAIKNDRRSALHCAGVPQQNDVLPYLKAKDYRFT